MVFSVFISCAAITVVITPKYNYFIELYVRRHCSKLKFFFFNYPFTVFLGDDEKNLEVDSGDVARHFE